MNTVQVWLARLGFDSPLCRYADQIAAECADKVWARLNLAMPIASADEARGYVRARAAVIIHRRVASGQAIHPRLHRQLIEMVSERLIERCAPLMLDHQAPVVRRAA